MRVLVVGATGLIGSSVVAGTTNLARLRAEPLGPIPAFNVACPAIPEDR